MKCLLCGGFMVYEEYFNPQETVLGMKCVICGEIIDPVILENRKFISTEQWMLSPKIRRAKETLHP